MDKISKKKLKYLGYSVVLQEVPDEISLAINISGCPVKCQDCHSKYLWEYTGDYISDDIYKILDIYGHMISCICFMGGNQNINELKELCSICKNLNYKTCLYTGYELNEHLKAFALKYLDYLKVGAFDKNKGGLNSPTTNQKMFKINKNDLKDITYKFQKERSVNADY